jgi:hypothetical protein
VLTTVTAEHHSVISGIQPLFGRNNEILKVLGLLRSRKSVTFLFLLYLWTAKQAHRNASCVKAKIEPVDFSWIPHAAQRV